MTVSVQDPGVRVLLAHNTYLHAGGEDHVARAEAALLESMGADVRMHLVSNERIAGMDRAELALKTVWNRDEARRLRDVLTNYRPHVVHVHNTLPLLSPAVYYEARSLGIPIVQTLHNYRLICPSALMYRGDEPCRLCVDRPVPWPAIRYACYRNDRAATTVVASMLAVHRLAGTYRNVVDRYIVLSNFARQSFIEGGVPERKIRVKPNFLEVDPGEGTGCGGFALFVGRLSPEKGWDIAVDAWERYSPSIPLEIVGDGPDREVVAERVRDLTNVRWQGPLARVDVLGRMKAAAVVIVPSRTYENFPLTIVEAYAAGTPVIAAGHGSLEEIVQDGRTGFHFRPGDAAHLAERVAAAVASGSDRAAMRTAARQAFLDHYTAERNGMSLRKIYDEVIDTAWPSA